jgi:hypothetical protein
MERFIDMFARHEEGREAPGNGSNPIHPRSGLVPTGYKIAIGLLLLSLVIVSLILLQQMNMLQSQNNQLVSHSSNLDQQNSSLNRIITLGESQVLANHVALNWSAGMPSRPLEWSCVCFQYSGYLHVNWTSPMGSMALRIVQFNLNLTTPSGSKGDFRVPVSGLESFSAWSDFASCYSSQCQATYSAVYHY